MAAPEKPPTEHPLPERIPLIHNAALAGTILVPMVMLLPPRRMDLRFFVLAGTFSIASNQLAYEYTGQSLYARFNSRLTGAFTVDLPEGAQRTQRLLREHREREAAAAAAKAAAGNSQAGARSDDDNKGLRGTVRSVWMGSESEGWKEKRLEEHRQALEEGKGLGGIIMDQIAEVFGGGKDKSTDKRDDHVDADANDTGRPKN